jgi:hypothetical protein
MNVASCNIVAVARRRDGGTRYWCLEHKADATAKYGRKGKRCRYAHVSRILPEDTARIELAQFAGGIALWGAVPPVYDTTRLPIDRGIHLHARSSVGGPKIIDRTLRSVEVSHEGALYVISELDAIYFMVASVFGFVVKYIACSRCDYPHLDKDWFSVHPHQSHLCAGCGRTFRDSEAAIGNPVAAMRSLPFTASRRPRRTRKVVQLKQAEYQGGIRVWGSNAAILWTSDSPPEDGIHVHAYSGDAAEEPIIDDTFARVTIDGYELDASQVRTLMAQAAPPHLAGRVQSVTCDRCGETAWDKNEHAYTLGAERRCHGCGRDVRAKGRFRRVVSNPLVGVLAQLAEGAPRRPQHHDLGLLPETL